MHRGGLGLENLVKVEFESCQRARKRAWNESLVLDPCLFMSIPNEWTGMQNLAWESSTFIYLNDTCSRRPPPLPDSEAHHLDFPKRSSTPQIH